MISATSELKENMALVINQPSCIQEVRSATVYLHSPSLAGRHPRSHNFSLLTMDDGKKLPYIMVLVN